MEHVVEEQVDLTCLNENAECRGPVEMRWVGEKAWPRCEKHGRDRLAQRERSIERYAGSATAPSWFDPTAAGESW